MSNEDLPCFCNKTVCDCGSGRMPPAEPPLVPSQADRENISRWSGAANNQEQGEDPRLGDYRKATRAFQVENEQLRKELEAARRDKCVGDELCEILGRYVGETGDSEGAVQVLERIIAGTSGGAQLARLKAFSEDQAKQIARLEGAVYEKSDEVYGYTSLTGRLTRELDRARRGK